MLILVFKTTSILLNEKPFLITATKSIMNSEPHLSHPPIPCSSEQGWQVPTDELEAATEPETLMDGCAWLEETLGKLMDKFGLREAFEEEDPNYGAEGEGGFELFGALLSMLPKRSSSASKIEAQPFALEMDRLPTGLKFATLAPIVPCVAPKCKAQLEFNFPDEETIKSLARKHLSQVKALRAKRSLASLMQGVCTSIHHCFGSEFSCGSGLNNFLKRMAEKHFAIHRKDQTRCTDRIFSAIKNFQSYPPVRMFITRMAMGCSGAFSKDRARRAERSVSRMIYSSEAQHRYLLRWKCRYRATWVLLCFLYTLIKRERLPLIGIGK
jgi:hypothetical protein